jgi:hypothetical protein
MSYKNLPETHAQFRIAVRKGARFLREAEQMTPAERWDNMCKMFEKVRKRLKAVKK